MPRRPIPIALAVAACLGLSACGERPAAQAPPPAIPDEAPPATTAATTAATTLPATTTGVAPPVPRAAPAMPMHFGSDDPRLGSEVGQRTPGAGLVADGRAGWLVYGPYAHLDAGRYEARIEGSVGAGHGGVLHVDVARNTGQIVITSKELAPAALADPSAGGALAALPFQLDAAAPDIEVRVRVTAASRVTVSGIEIRPLP